MRVGVLLHAVVNVAFAAQALGVTTAEPGQGPVRPVVASDAVVVSLRPAAAPSGPPIGAIARVAPTAPSTTAAARPAATSARSPTTTVRTTTTTIDLSVERFDRLAQCESDGDPEAINGPYRGAFQFLVKTWHDAGGAGDPIDASYDEQRRVAMSWARVVDPASQWPVCWPLTG